MPSVRPHSPVMSVKLSSPKRAARRSAPQFAMLPAKATGGAASDYGTPQFTGRLIRKFHAGRRKAIAQARKAGLL